MWLHAALLAATTWRQPAGDARAQFPAFLVNSYFSISAGFIDYAFSARQLQPGFTAGSISVPHPAVRVALFGHELNRYVSAQLTYMRPVHYVTYTNVSGDDRAHHVWTHFGGASAIVRAPLGERASIYAEAGLGITSRDGFNGSSGTPVVRSAHYASWLAGGGIERRLTRSIDVTAGATYVPGHDRDAEPGALLVSGGFRYTMRPLPSEQVERNRSSGYVFPANLVQLEYATGHGYAVNTFLSERVPVFWGGHVKTDRGIAVHYDRDVFHTRKVFALDFGVSASSWRSRTDRESFATLSVYPLFRFMFLRTTAADFYACYSLAGPTYISRVRLDGLDTGAHFTFQDFIGAGAYLGARRNVVAGLKINHYSNGNIFTTNAGVKVPLTLTIGFAF